MSKLSKFFSDVTTFLKESKEKVVRGYKWIGTDGIVNMETSAILVMIFMIFFPILWASFLTFIIVVGKCALDKTRGREDEKHDFICSIVGILLGVILGTVQVAVSLF